MVYSFNIYFKTRHVFNTKKVILHLKCMDFRSFLFSNWSPPCGHIKNCSIRFLSTAQHPPCVQRSLLLPITVDIYKKLEKDIPGENITPQQNGFVFAKQLFPKYS